MLKRKIYDRLLDWKSKKSRECLLVRGARQIGKTFIIEEFGKKQYKSYVYLNFIGIRSTSKYSRALWRRRRFIRKYPCMSKTFGFRKRRR